MNMLTSATPPDQTMTSREIADLCQKRHDNVMQVIRDLISAQILTPEIQESTFEHRGNTYKCFLLNKRDSLVTVARLSPEFTAAVVDRWQELEAKQAPREPNRIELAQWVIEAETKLAQANEQLAIAAPKAAALDRIADATGLFGVREAAKSLKVRQSDLTTLLVNRGWAYRDRRDVLQPSAEKTARGYVTAVMSKPIEQADGQERVFSQLRITSKGIARLAQILAKGAAA